MCSKGNQTISRDCWEEALKKSGRPTLTNQDARRLIVAEGGCLMGHGLTNDQLNAAVHAIKMARLDAANRVMAK